MAEKPKRITDIGPPHYEKFLHPVIKENYGKWEYHEILKPGVMVHVGESGDKLYTVRVASPRLLAIESIRKFCDIADKYCDGYLRFTSRNNVEFLLTDAAKIQPLKKELDELPARGRILRAAAMVTSSMNSATAGTTRARSNPVTARAAPSRSGNGSLSSLSLPSRLV